jgi:hypothetical protein
MLRIGRECCPYCHGSNVYVSDPESLWEEIAVLMLLRPVRCHDCMHRFYRPLSIPTLIALGSAESMKPKQQADAVEEDKPPSA